MVKRFVIDPNAAPPVYEEKPEITRPGTGIDSSASHFLYAAAGPEYPTGAPVIDPQQMAEGRFSRFAGTLRLAPATYVLLAINVGIFALMVVAGVNFKLPTEQNLLDFGANNAWLVLQGQWWRLLTAMFVHVGIIHLATNMWCLWNLGLLGEPLLGAFGVFCVYVLTGAAGNLLSIAASVLSDLLNGTELGWLIQWTGASMNEVGAGASGAVFGIAGILIVLLSNRQLAEPRNGHPGIPLSELQRLRKSVVWFAAINLFIGVASIAMPIVRIDNMAHLGGVMCGLAMGLPLLPRMTSGRARYLGRQRVTFAVSVLILVLFGVWISKLHG